MVGPPPTAGVRRLSGALFAVLAAACGPAAADEGCTAAFERWVKLSEARVRKQPSAQANAGPEACLPKEEVRAELMRAMGTAKRRCDASGAADDTTTKTKAMLNINESFIALLPVCRVQDQPPPQQAQRNTIAANRSCLQVAPARDGQYALTNTRCRGQTVLAVIERRLPSGKTECRAQTIETQAQVEAPESEPPQLNYQCVLNASDCTQERLSTLFPECDW